MRDELILNNKAAAKSNFTAALIYSRLVFLKIFIGQTAAEGAIDNYVINQH